LKLNLPEPMNRRTFLQSIAASSAALLAPISLSAIGKTAPRGLVTAGVDIRHGRFEVVTISGGVAIAHPVVEYEDALAILMSHRPAATIVDAMPEVFLASKLISQMRLDGLAAWVGEYRTHSTGVAVAAMGEPYTRVRLERTLCYDALSVAITRDVLRLEKAPAALDVLANPQIYRYSAPKFGRPAYHWENEGASHVDAAVYAWAARELVTS
jgi:hypothetical protein